MTDPMVITLTLIIVGQVCFSVPLFFVRSIKSAMCFPLALFLLANGVLALNPLISSVLPHWYQFYTALSFPMVFVLCPSLWFYVEGVTSKTYWKLTLKQARHYILLIPGLIISVMIMLLPQSIHTAIFIDNIEVLAPFEITLILSILVMMLLWLGQCIYIMCRIIHRLVTYRKQLKNLYSNHEGKKLSWMNWLLFIAICTWLSSLATVFSSNLFGNYLFNARTEAFLSLLLIWSLAHFGLQQKAEFTDPRNNNMNPAIKNKGKNIKEKNSVAEEPQKYQRSALGVKQSERIAEKINAVMKNDKLYLDANLSLQKLANHVAISPNYISQTLNETLSINFFDFVNKWRISAAKPKIIANEDTVLNIALDVGFNARSSFYKAFKQETGTTPSDFRKHHIQH